MKKKSLLYRNEAEKRAIASVIVDPGCVGTLLAALTPDDYYNVAYRIAHAAVAKLVEKGQDIDLFLVFEEAQALGATSEDTMLIQAVADELPNPALIEEYVKQVKDASIRRRAQERLVKAHAEISNDPMGADDVLHRISADLVDPLWSGSNAAISMADVAVAEIERLHRAASVKTVHYPWEAVNLNTGGMMEEQLIVIGARPGVGKTAVGLQMAIFAAYQNPGRVLYVSAEMSGRQLWMRMLHQLLGVAPVRMARGILDEEQKRRVAGLTSEFIDRPVFMYVMDSGVLSPDSIAARARLLNARGGLDLIIIDYLQLLDSEREESRAQEVSRMTGKLKGLARNMGIPIVLLSQLNRASAAEDRPPDLHDLRESGSIEQDADLVFFIHRKTAGTESEIKRTKLMLSKHRMGPTDIFDCEYSLERGTLERMHRHG